MRDGLADPFHLAEHRAFVGRIDLLRVWLLAEGHDDRQGSRQRHLKAHGGRNVTGDAGSEKVLVRRTRLTSVAQLAEVDLFGVHAICQLQWDLSLTDLDE